MVYPWNLKLVPIKEMPDVLRVPRKIPLIKRGDWVRVKRGVNKNDIAQVYESDETRGLVTIRLIPRLDLTSWSKKQEGLHSGDEIEEEEIIEDGIKKKRVKKRKSK